MNLAEFEKVPVMGILRGIKEEDIEPLFEEIVGSGLKTIEITMNTEGAGSCIRKAIDISKDRLTVGAGTVTNMERLHVALDAGAGFIVMPTVKADVLDYCVKNNIPVFPGALTPTEIFNAWECGASMVKVFPSKFFGPEYFKEIKGPFDDIKLLACGGVNENNIKKYFQCGADGIAFGVSIFKKELIERKDFKTIGEGIARLILLWPSGDCPPCKNDASFAKAKRILTEFFMQKSFSVKTKEKDGLYDITGKVKEIVALAGVASGIVNVYVRGATAAVMVQENWDDSVQRDVVAFLKKIIPNGIWEHDRQDGNGDAHIKSGLVGPGESIPVIDGELGLSTWQNIFLCEFDGPRSEREIVITVIKS